MDIVRTGQESDETLVVGQSVLLVKDRKELKNAACLIALATVNERALLEGPVDGVLFSDTGGKDHLHYRRGILDEVTAKILASGKKALVIDICGLLLEKHFSRALGRALQDARLATTHGADVVFVSLGDYEPSEHDLEATAVALGFNEQTVRKNQRTLQAWIARAQHRASSLYVGEGISKTA